MGARKRHREAFLGAHPVCCFCAEAPATTIDHVPARTCFRGRVGPEDFEFPACEACNSASRTAEQVFGFLVRVFNAEDNGPPDDLAELVRHLRNNAPDCLPSADISTNQKRKILKHWQLEPSPGTSYAEVGLIQVPKAVNAHVRTFGRKLLRAVHYKELGTPLPQANGTAVGYSQLQIPSTLEAVQTVEAGLPGLTMGARRNTDIGAQFSYRWGTNDAQGLFAVMAQFGASILILAFAAPKDVIQESGAPIDWMY